MTIAILLQFLLRLGKSGFYLFLIQLKIYCMMTCATRRKFPSNLQHQQKIMKLVILGFCCNVIFDAIKQYQTSPWSCFTLKSISMITRLAPDIGFGLQHRANIFDHKYINKKSVEVKNIHLQALE